VDPLRRADAMQVIINSSLWTPSNDDVITRAIEEVSRITPIDRSRAMRILLQASMTATTSGDLPLALQLAEQATDLLDSDTDSVTGLEARHIYAMISALTGRQSEARRFFDEWTIPQSVKIAVAELYGNQYAWTVQILNHLGRYTEAEGLMRA